MIANFDIFASCLVKLSPVVDANINKYQGGTPKIQCFKSCLPIPFLIILYPKPFIRCPFDRVRGHLGPWLWTITCDIQYRTHMVSSLHMLLYKL